MTMVHSAFRKMLLILLAVILMMPALLPRGAGAETGSSGCTLVTLEVSLRRNTLIAKHGVTIYLDGMQVQHIDQGGLATLHLLVARGNHRLLFVPDKAKAKSCAWDLSLLHDEYVLECGLQTHMRYTELRSHRVTADSRLLTEQVQKRLLNWTLKLSDAIPFVDVSAEFSGSI